MARSLFETFTKIGQGKRKKYVSIKNGDQSYIVDVYYVPDMKNNILSLGQLLKKGYDF